MKKLLYLLLALSLMLSFSACNNKNGEPTDEPSGVNSSSETGSKAESMKLVYDIDEKEITIYLPEGCEFSSEEQDGSDMISLNAEDLSWTMDIWASSVYENGNGEPFATYYFNGELDDYWSGEFTSFDQEVRDLGFEFEGKPVKVVESTYVEADEDEEETDVFVGFEYESTRNGKHYGDGLLGFQINAYGDVPSDEELGKLFKQLFGIDK